MFIGVMRVKIMIGDATSLKDKRRVLLSLKSRIRERFEVSAAEVDEMDQHQIGVLGIAAVSNSGAHARQILDKIADFIRGDGRFVVLNLGTDVLGGLGL